MKIKHLSIRNIASVETADIDFEHGPVDHSTGRPADLFLITGDTGSGKSVILDCISMALYGTTPRVKGVNGVNNNTYRYGDGNEVSVADIRQYTRLGISHKDACHARLVFEGNDGVVYEACFELGFNNRHKYRDPRWTLRIGKSALLDRKEEIRSQIVKAVGLSFDQFGRMAMLAQGQFANFLTGKKEERERILEQLTATDRFSRYGEAITNLFRRAKEARTIAENSVSTFRNLILTDEKVLALQKELAETDAEAAATDVAARAQAAVTKANNELTDSMADLTVCRRVFDAMTADLSARRSALDLRRRAIDADKEWIANLGPRRDIYEKAPVTIELIKTYDKYAADIDTKLKSLPAAEKERDEWATKVSACEGAVVEAAKAVEVVKEKIDALTAERRDMNPECILEQHTAASRLHKSLTDLVETIRKAENDRAETAVVKADVEKLELDFKALTAKVDEARSEEARCEKEARRADELYTTMHLSVEKNFTELRKRLADEGASHCPLCRQPIADHDALTSGETFSGILSPLEEERNRRAAILKAAKENFTKLNGDLKKLEGNFNARSAELARLQKRDADASARIDEALAALSVADRENPMPEISAKIASTSATIDALKQKMDLAEDIQKQVNTFLEERGRLDQAKNKADKDFKNASSKFQSAELTVKATNETLATLANSRMELKERLDETLRGYNDEWSADTAMAVARLRAEADDYTARQEKINAAEKELGSDTATLDGLNRTAETLTSILADIPPTPAQAGDDVSGLPLKNVSNKWTELHSIAAAAHSNLQRCRSEISHNTLIVNDFFLSRNDNEQLKEVPLAQRLNELNERKGAIAGQLNSDTEHRRNAERLMKELEAREVDFDRWNRLNTYFGGTRFRTLVQSHILRPLLRNANVYLEQITDHYTLTCSDDNEQLSILVLDRYNRNETRSVTVLSGGERFMISLALSLALSAMSRPDMNVDILFIDEGFGTLDAKSLDQVMNTLRRLPQIAGQTGRRVGVISHREELAEQIDSRIILRRCGEGRSRVVVE